MATTLTQTDILKKEAESLLSANTGLEKVFWDKFRLEFNYNSNHLEGNTLTYGHTQLLLLFDKVGGDYSLRELEEMKAHDVAMKMMKEAALDPEHVLTEKFIKEINGLLIVRPFYKEAITPDGQSTRRLIEPGQYKKYPNSVRLENGEIFSYTPPEETPAQMGDLMEWYRKESEVKELHPVQLAALFHYRFVRVHPFDDGNGRTSRLLMNYILLRNGYAPVVIESADKKNYLAALNKADSGDINAFVTYITGLGLRWQEFLVRALKGESIEEAEDFDKEVEILKRKILFKEVSSLSIDDKTINTAFENSIFHLLSEIEKKLTSLDDFFQSKRIEVEIRNNKTSEISNQFTRQSIKEIEQRLSSNILEIRKGRNIILSFCHNGFIHSKLLTKISTITEIMFENESFVISFPNSSINPNRINYNNSLKSREIEEIANTLAKNELNIISSYIR